MNIKIRNGAVTIGANTILEEVNLDINDKDKIAIVGRNGAGKTTLLKALITPTMFESGVGEEKFSITTLGKFKIGYLEQITFKDEEVILIDEVRKSFSHLIEMEKRINNLTANDLQDLNAINEYTELMENYKLLGGYSYKKEYEKLLNTFGFKEEDKTKKIRDFSGGEKTKIAFIKLLLSKPDLLILDEPTNHLDIATIENLESYLKDYPGTLIIVSHDRLFLDNIVNIVYEIDYGRVYKYKGNYSYYEKEKNIRYEKTLKDYEYQQKEIKRLRNIYERFRSKPTKASMALSKLKQIERMDLIEKPREEDLRTFKTNLDNLVKTSEIVMSLKDLSIGYDKSLATINLEIRRGHALGIIGENGTGKSTLLKTLSKIIPPYAGEVCYGHNLQIGYFDQNLAMQDNTHTVLEEFREYVPNLNYEETRRALGSFLFKDDDINKKVNVLSGGEKVRLQLCKILYNKPNVLILDEPTNHMDIVSKEHLESILKSYPGTLIFVSHDRYFVRKIATELLVFANNEVTYYPYGYQEYEEKKAKEIIEDNHEVKVKETKVNSNELRNREKELSKLEKSIAKKEQEIKELKNSLFNEDVYSDYQKVKEINDLIKAKEDELVLLNNSWEELMKKVYN